MAKNNYALILVVVLIFGCTANTGSGEESTEEQAEATKEVSELTYFEVLDMVFGETGERIEWHGEEMPNKLVSQLLIEEGAACGEDDCGKALTLTNLSDRPIGFIIKGAYDIQGDQGFMVKQYELQGGESADIGCTHLCYGGAAFLFDRSIVGSWYLDE